MHPGAETLSAFTEQALSAKERGEVLAHLAVCGRCRQVVALAREAAGAEVAATRHEVVRPRAWWRSWGLAVVPVSAMAATALIAFYVHERAAQRTSDVAKLEQQQPNEKAASPPQALPQSPAQAAPPAPATPVDAPTKPRETERPDEARRKPAAEPDETAGAPPAAPPDAPRAESIGGTLPSRVGPAETPGFERHGMAFARAGAPADDKSPSGSSIYDEEHKKRADEAAEERHQSVAKAATPAGLHDSEVDETKIDKTEIDKTGIDKTSIDNAGSAPAESPTAQSSEQVEVNSQQLQPQPVPDVSAGSLMRMRSSAISPARMATPIHLPSGLPALSVASSDHFVLAIDKKGTLFFSDDSGLAWRKVKRQWTGRAILVRKKNSEDAAAPAAAPEGPGSNSTADALSHPETIFELFNDQNDLWLSADGRFWTAK